MCAEVYPTISWKMRVEHSPGLGLGGGGSQQVAHTSSCVFFSKLISDKFRRSKAIAWELQARRLKEKHSFGECTPNKRQRKGWCFIPEIGTSQCDWEPARSNWIYQQLVAQRGPSTAWYQGHKKMITGSKFTMRSRSISCFCMGIHCYRTQGAIPKDYALHLATHRGSHGGPHVGKPQLGLGKSKTGLPGTEVQWVPVFVL